MKNKLPYAEKDLIKGMTPHTAHADELAKLSESEAELKDSDKTWDSWFNGSGVSDDFISERTSQEQSDREFFDE